MPQFFTSRLCVVFFCVVFSPPSFLSTLHQCQRLSPVPQHTHSVILTHNAHTHTHTHTHTPIWCGTSAPAVRTDRNPFRCNVIIVVIHLCFTLVLGTAMLKSSQTKIYIKHGSVYIFIDEYLFCLGFDYFNIVSFDTI